MLVRLILNQMAGSDLDGLQLGRASRKRTPEKALVDAVLNCIRTMRRVRDDENSCDVLDFVDLRKCMGAVWPKEYEEQCDAHEVVHRLVGLVCTHGRAEDAFGHCRFTVTRMCQRSGCHGYTSRRSHLELTWSVIRAAFCRCIPYRYIGNTPRSIQIEESSHSLNHHQPSITVVHPDDNWPCKECPPSLTEPTF